MKGWRTVIINLIFAILPTLEAADLTNVLSPHGMEMYAASIGVINLVLRAITTTPLGKAN